MGNESTTDPTATAFRLAREIADEYVRTGDDLGNLFAVFCGVIIEASPEALGLVETLWRKVFDGERPKPGWEALGGEPTPSDRP